MADSFLDAREQPVSVIDYAMTQRSFARGDRFPERGRSRIGVRGQVPSRRAVDQRSKVGAVAALQQGNQDFPTEAVEAEDCQFRVLESLFLG